MTYEAGSGIVFKEINGKTVICSDVKTKLKEGNFNLEAEQIVIEAGVGIKISSKGKDTLVVSANLTKMEEAIFDYNKRIEVVEKSLVNILSILKVLKVVKE